MRFRVVASDIDGTLLRSDETVSERTVRAIDAAVATGATFILATGRPPRWVPMIAEMTGHRGLAVCSNGALVIDLHDERIIDVQLHSKASATIATDAVIDLLPDAMFAVDGPGGFGHTPTYVSVFPQRAARIAPLAELLDGVFTKIMFRHPDMNAELLDELIDRIGDNATVTFGSMGDDLGPRTLIEMMPFGVTKAAALQRIADRNGASAEDVIAFGDMPNDIDMLTWAGHGVAMGNAHPSAKEAADEVTASNNEDGLALVLEREVGATLR